MCENFQFTSMPDVSYDFYKLQLNYSANLK